MTWVLVPGTVASGLRGLGWKSDLTPCYEGPRYMGKEVSSPLWNLNQGHPPTKGSVWRKPVCPVDIRQTHISKSKYNVLIGP